jgi:hypothetical protein
METKFNTYLRIRPVLQSEIAQGGYTQCIASKGKIAYITKDNAAIVIDPTKGIVENDKITSCTFDHIFDIDSQQADVFGKIGVPSVEHVLKGYNVTLFAYGQTATGKTYTMEGTLAPEGRGLGRHILESLFEKIDLLDSNNKVYLNLSITQIYNEDVYDLLSPTAAKVKLR